MLRQVSAAAVFLSLFFLCTIPENPDNPDNASGRLQFYSPASGISDSLVSDSIGSVIDINVSYTFVHYIDSITLQVLSEDSSTSEQTIDTSITLSLDSDTVATKQTFKIALITAGIKTVILTSYKSNGSISTNQGTIIVYPRETEEIAPEIVSTPALTAVEGKTWHYEPVAVSPGATLLVWSLSGKNASQMDFDSLTGAITWTPGQGVSSSDSLMLTIKIVDAPSLWDSQTFVISVITDTESIPPVANPLSLTLPEDDSLHITLSGTDSDTSRSLVYSIVSITAAGTLSTINGTAITYTPARNFFGVDSFSYRVFNGELYSDPAKVTLTVTAVNDTPAFSTQALSTDLNTPLTLTLKGSDVEDSTLTFRIVSGPASGSLDTSALPELTYTPSTDFKGTDTLRCRAIDSEGLESPDGIITIAVASDNQKPSGNPLSITIAEDNDTTITLSGSDIETPADQLSYRIYRQPSNGTLGDISGDKVLYTPNADFNGQDTFYYTVNDGTVDSDSSRVVVRITPVNDIPVSVADMYSANEDQVLTVTAADGVLKNDTDPEHDALTAELVDQVATDKGSVLLSTDGSFIFTPAPNANGNTTFTYHASDDKGGVGATTTVTIAIAAQNDPAVFSGLSAISVNEGDSVIREIVATDPDQTTPTVSLTDGQQTWITVSQPADNRLRLAIKPGYNVVQSGQNDFKLHFRATDGQAPVDDSLLITVINVNQKPSVSLSLTKATDTVAVGTSLSITVTATDDDGSVTGVRLYHNNTLLTDNTAPYQFTISDLSYASHTFRAVAIDNSNDSTGTQVYTVKAGRWASKMFSSSDQYQFDNNGVPARTSFNLYSDRLIMDVVRYNMVSETWASTGSLTIDTATLNLYQSRNNGIFYSSAFTQNNTPVLLLEFTKDVLDGNGDLQAFDFSFLVYSQSSSGTWSRVGSVVSKLTLTPVTSISTSITVSSAGTIAFCLNQTEMKSNVSSTTYIQSGSGWTTVANPVLYTDITYLGTTLYSHCGSYIYENPAKVHSLSGTTWTPVGGDGTVAASYQQHNVLTRGSDGTLYISVPDKGVFSNSNSATWHRVWPTDNAGTDTSAITVSIVDGTPYITYVENTDYTLYCKRILNGVASGILDADGPVATLSSAYNGVSIFSSQRTIMLKISTDQLYIYRLDIPD